MYKTQTTNKSAIKKVIFVLSSGFLLVLSTIIITNVETRNFIFGSFAATNSNGSYLSTNTANNSIPGNKITNRYVNFSPAITKLRCTGKTVNFVDSFDGTGLINGINVLNDKNNTAPYSIANGKLTVNSSSSVRSMKRQFNLLTLKKDFVYELDVSFMPDTNGFTTWYSFVSFNLYDVQKAQSSSIRKYGPVSGLQRYDVYLPYANEARMEGPKIVMPTNTTLRIERIGDKASFWFKNEFNRFEQLVSYTAPVGNQITPSFSAEFFNTRRAESIIFDEVRLTYCE